MTVGGGATSHVFNSAPNQVWSVKIRARNSAGHSAWTPAAQTRTSPGGELIIGPDVTYRQGNPIVTWKSKENAEDLIESFQLEWKTEKDDQWRQHRNPVNYISFYFMITSSIHKEYKLLITDPAQNW